MQTGWEGLLAEQRSYLDRFWMDTITHADAAQAGGAPAPGGLATEQVLALLIFAIAGVFLFVQSLIRIAILNLAVVLTPLAMLCWVLPQWTWLYEIWLRILVATSPDFQTC